MRTMLIKLIKSVNFKEAHFAVKLLQIVVSDASPKQVQLVFSRSN